MEDLFSFSEKTVYTISGLNALIKNELEEAFSNLWLEGEVSNLRIPQSGHCYLTLKDERSQVKAIVFKSTLKGIKFIPKEGQQLLCSGRITVYEPRGEYQIVLESVEPKGVGALQLAFEQLKEKLRLKGWFEQGRKREIPAFPRRIGIVTSPTGAAIRDMLQIIERRHPAVNILIYPVPVQGAEAPSAIAHAIEEMNQIGGIDVLIIGRGGGSLEDLWAFNEETVAEAVFKSAIPVISAVGHETDVTIADFVADLRAPTPSAAAELVVKNHLDLIESIRSAQSRLVTSCQRNLEGIRKEFEKVQLRILSPRKLIESYSQKCDDYLERLSVAVLRTVAARRTEFESFCDRLDYQNPAENLKRLEVEVKGLIDRLVNQAKHRLLYRRKEIEALVSNLGTLGPLDILRRGYSITRKLPERSILKSNREVRKEESVEIILAEGKVEARITETTS
ncbi:MAG: exodeoxyribonuclease VII large subunit [Nitrospirae bacterium]|nr:exodeoxyribonuclease VII large subunit [Nitrospirota bacterium]MBI3594527.1 exodeoxyribonuclease VII large subunit [Nitrospirota bacterium]